LLCKTKMKGATSQLQEKGTKHDKKGKK
jgi:hypothetical protein